MAVFTQGNDARVDDVVFGIVPDVFDPSIGASAWRGVDFLDESTPLAAGGSVSASTTAKPSATPATYVAEEVPESSGGLHWFELVHVIPRSFDFGNLLSEQSTPIEVFNAYTRLSQEWASFTNGAGAGTTLGGQPSLPVTIGNLNGVEMTLDVSTTGAAIIDDVLAFTFTGLGTTSVTIKIQRIVLWSREPELPFGEVLSFLVDIHRSIDGTERRERLREYPRQSWSYDFKIEESEAALFDNLLFDFQSRSFGVPVWWDDSRVTANVAAGASSITVNSTDYRDYRVGGLAVVLSNATTFDVLTIASVTATTVTFTSPTINAHSAGAPVFPLAVCSAKQRLQGGRRRVGMRDIAIEFSNTDNVVDLADLSAWGTYNSKVLIESPISMLSASIGYGYDRPFIELDGGVSEPVIDSDQDRSRIGRQLAIRAVGREAVWNLRGLVYGLHGSQKSFYVPTYAADLTATSDLLITTNLLTVANVGYAQYVRNRQPKSDIRVNFVDGSTPLTRAITGSTVVSSVEDQLTVDSNWLATVTPAEIERIEYLEKVRFASDDIQLRFHENGNIAHLIAGVEGVFE